MLWQRLSGDLLPGWEPVNWRRLLTVLYRCGDLEFGHETSDSLFQVVSDRSDCLDGLARWVFDFPVNVAFAREAGRRYRNPW